MNDEEWENKSDENFIMNSLNVTGTEILMCVTVKSTGL
jgi:hypothetical protein